MAASLLTTAAPAQHRDTALVIGNADYADAGTPLPAVIQDATAVADELRRMHFDVELKTDVGKDEMRRAIADFTGRIAKGSVAAFYFGGIGVQVGRRSYLIPTNAQIWTEADVRRDGISIDALLTDLRRKDTKVNIIIVDAARRNPFEPRFRATTDGLAPVEAPVGTLMIYSDALGKVLEEGAGANGIFAKALIRELRSTNLNGEDIFNRTRINVSRASNGRQVPWVASSLLEEFRFASGSPTRTAAPTPPLSRTPSLPAPAPTPQTAALPPPVQECDRLASHPEDKDKVAAGIEFQNLDFARAIPACRSAIEAYPNVPRYAYQLGRVLHKGKVYSEAMAYYRQAVDGGYLPAMYGIGSMYLEGAGGEKDYGKALEWFSRSAQFGTGLGYEAIGIMHQNGWGVAKDPASAMSFYRKAAELNNPFAMVSLGSAYATGVGLRKNAKRANALYREAVDIFMTPRYRENSKAMYYLGTMYEVGAAVRKDRAEAVGWYRKAALKGDEQANEALKRLGYPQVQPR